MNPVECDLRKHLQILGIAAVCAVAVLITTFATRAPEGLVSDPGGERSDRKMAAASPVKVSSDSEPVRMRSIEESGTKTVVNVSPRVMLRVKDAKGMSVPGALVFTGTKWCATADVNGSVTVEDSQWPITIFGEGVGWGRFEQADVIQQPHGGDMPTLILQHTSRVKVTVLNVTGNLGEDWQYTLIGGEPWDASDWPPCFHEGLACSQPSPTFAGDRSWKCVNGNSGSVPHNGSFELFGLRAEALYRVRLWNLRTMQLSESPEWRGSCSNVAVHVGLDATRKLFGRVRDNWGREIAAARLRVSQVVCENAGRREYISGRETTSGIDGSYEILDAPASAAVLVAKAKGFGDATMDIQAGAMDQLCDITMRRGVALRLVRPDDLGAVAITLVAVDNKGDAVRMEWSVATGVTQGGVEWRGKFVGRLEISVPDNANELQIYMDEKVRQIHAIRPNERYEATVDLSSL